MLIASMVPISAKGDVNDPRSDLSLGPPAAGRAVRDRTRFEGVEGISDNPID